MNLHERQQFDFLLVTAIERYTERLIQRCEGAENALTRLKEDVNAEGVWLDQYVDAIFSDFLLDNLAGACFVLQALPKRKHADIPSGKIEPTLIALAKSAFADVLATRMEESLEQSIMYNV